MTSAESLFRQVGAHFAAAIALLPFQYFLAYAVCMWPRWVELGRSVGGSFPGYLAAGERHLPQTLGYLYFADESGLSGPPSVL